MKYAILRHLMNLLFCCLAFIQISHAQKVQVIRVEDAQSAQALVAASVFIPALGYGDFTDDDGMLVLPADLNFPIRIEVRYIGYETVDLILKVPSETPLIIRLKYIMEDLEEIIVTATRSSKTIQNLPTRVEVITSDIEEAAIMDPSKIAHLLTHSTGLQLQTTSAASGAANVRMQGLDGRYTQILKDGFPAYGGFSGSLSILQIPPLDLQRVEFIKGSASTLYGGGAIAGLVNLVSKDAAKREQMLYLNASDIGAFDINYWLSRPSEKLPMTMLITTSLQLPYDADRDGFTDLAAVQRIAIQPRVYFIDKAEETLWASVQLTADKRNGGDLRVLKEKSRDSIHFFQDKSQSIRLVSQLSYSKKITTAWKLSARNSFQIFDRQMQIFPAFQQNEQTLNAVQFGSFSELALSKEDAYQNLVLGMNLYTDRFTEKNTPAALSELWQTPGIFAQWLRNWHPRWSTELGFRADYVINLKSRGHFQVLDRLFLLPRANLLVKWSDQWTSRFGGGMGYKTPTVLLPEAEASAFRGLQIPAPGVIKPEESLGLNADINFRTSLGTQSGLQWNHLFFETTVHDPLILTGDYSSGFTIQNLDGRLLSRGFESQLRLKIQNLTWFGGYTFTYTRLRLQDGTKRIYALTPAHSIKGDLLWEHAGKWRFGADYEFKGQQELSDGRLVRAFWIFGILAERTFGNVAVFVNAENITDSRQSAFESLLSSPFGTPQFSEIWAPLDGRFFNAGCRIRW